MTEKERNRTPAESLVTAFDQGISFAPNIPNRGPPILSGGKSFKSYNPVGIKGPKKQKKKEKKDYFRRKLGL